MAWSRSTDHVVCPRSAGRCGPIDRRNNDPGSPSGRDRGPRPGDARWRPGTAIGPASSRIPRWPVPACRVRLDLQLRVQVAPERWRDWRCGVRRDGLDLLREADARASRRWSLRGSTTGSGGSRRHRRARSAACSDVDRPGGSVDGHPGPTGPRRPAPRPSLPPAPPARRHGAASTAARQHEPGGAHQASHAPPRHAGTVFLAAPRPGTGNAA